MNIHCQICGECAARFDGRLIIYSHSANHNVEIDVKELLKVLAGSEKGLNLLRDFYDEGLMGFVVK